MADSDKDRTKVEASPESTWGASEKAKKAWDEKYGKARRREAEKESKENE